MSFEQQEINRMSEDNSRLKKDKEKSEAFWLEKKIMRESSELLQKLAKEISKEFWISILDAKEIISGTTNSSLENLKNTIWVSHENINIQDFSNAISKARESIEDLSKKHREALKNSLEEEIFDPEKNTHPLTKNFIKEDLRSRIKNPQNFSDELIGAGIWIIDSSEAVILFTYALGKWILLTPYHIYLLLVWKAEFPYKNI